MLTKGITQILIQFHLSRSSLQEALTVKNFALEVPFRKYEKKSLLFSFFATIAICLLLIFAHMSVTTVHICILLQKIKLT